ncbi:MAG: CRISPR system precrRNA processing endoribonuclease RAMP protein Cas6 [Armatimonadetes bacterium]|nr:CRISPR system precrRNA processing endoribonuclease RAMP protein Cas6 [Armatimonadota bacterium]
MPDVRIALTEYRVRLCFLRAGHVSAYLGVTLRGGFGAALRRISCVKPTSSSCLDCLLQTSCPYGYLFETPVPSGQALMKLYTHAPHPIVLRPPLSIPSKVTSETQAELVVLLVGRASQYFPYVLQALLHLGTEGLGADRVPFRVDRVTGGSDGKLVYAADTPGPVQLLEPELVRASVKPPQDGLLAVHFITPMRLRVNNQVLRSPAFDALVSAALRRLELLARLHQSGEFHIHSAEVAATARQGRLVQNETHWHDVVRYSKRQDREMPLGGLVGRAVFAGPVLGLTELLSLAGRVHAGKATVFGNGHFRVEAISHD